MSELLIALERTKLVERFCGVFLYFIITAYYYFAIKQDTSLDFVRRRLNHLTIILCVMAFFYIPAESADIYRWREISLIWKNLSIKDFLLNVFLHSTSPVGYLMIFLCQKTGINGLLPAICAFIFYSNTFHIFISSTKTFNLSSKVLAVVFLFFMSAGMFLEVIAGVRCFVAFSIVSRCIYDEIVESKPLIRSILLYIIACLIHTAAIPLVGIRFVCLLFEHDQKIFAKIMNIFAALFLIALGVYFGQDLLDDAIVRGSGYASSNNYIYTWEYIIGVLGIATIIFIINKFRKSQRHKKIQLDNIYRVLVLLVLVELVFVRSYNIFHRFVVPIYLLIIPILGVTLSGALNELVASKNYKENRSSVNYIVIIKVITFIIFLISATRGNLCGYKFFIL